jgi:hypothetical protein
LVLRDSAVAEVVRFRHLAVSNASSAARFDWQDAKFDRLGKSGGFSGRSYLYCPNYL